MIFLNINNVENLIFYDNQIQVLLPEFKPLFDSWKLSIRYSFLRSLGKRSTVDFLNHLTEDHIAVLSKHFGDEVKVDRLDYHIVRNSDGDLNSLDLSNLYPNLAFYRDEHRGYISSWR